MRASPLIKVLHVFKTYYPFSTGGVETVINDLSTGLRDQCIFEVLCVNEGDSQGGAVINGVPVTWVSALGGPRKSPLFNPYSLKIRKLLNWADIIHYHHPYPMCDLLFFSVARNKPSIVTYHADIMMTGLLRNLYKPVEKMFLKLVDAVVCTSNVYCESSKLLNSIDREYEIIPLSLSESEFNSEKTENRFEGTFEKLEYYLFIGAHRWYKNLFELLAAAHSTDKKILIVGEGEETKQLKLFAKEKKLTNVIFLGWVNEIEKQFLLKSCYALVLPSNNRAEAYGLVLLEAMRVGAPVITSDIESGMAFINIHNQTGLHFGERVNLELGDCFDILDNNLEKRNIMSMNAKKRFDTTFSFDKFLSAYENLYRKVLKNE